MKKSAHARSALFQNMQFRAHIAREKCCHFNKVGKKLFSQRSLENFYLLLANLILQALKFFTHILRLAFQLFISIINFVINH